MPDVPPDLPPALPETPAGDGYPLLRSRYPAELVRRILARSEACTLIGHDLECRIGPNGTHYAPDRFFGPEASRA